MHCVEINRFLCHVAHQVDEESGDVKQGIERSFDVAGVTDERFLELNFSGGIEEINFNCGCFN